MGILRTNFSVTDEMARQEAVPREARPQGEHTEKVVTTNRKARHDYEILDTYEAGIVLTGAEVKSLRQGNANLADSHAVMKNGELWLLGMHISPYDQGSYANVDPLRTRKLLLHKREIIKIAGKVSTRGLTLIPLRVYFARNIAKVLLGLARGKKEYDRREDIAKRDAERSIRQRLRR
jgi:SsrA-binding protein